MCSDSFRGVRLQNTRLAVCALLCFCSFICAEMKDLKTKEEVQTRASNIWKTPTAQTEENMNPISCDWHIPVWPWNKRQADSCTELWRNAESCSEQKEKLSCDDVFFFVFHVFSVSGNTDTSHRWPRVNSHTSLSVSLWLHCFLLPEIKTEKKKDTF